MSIFNHNRVERKGAPENCDERVYHREFVPGYSPLDFFIFPYEEAARYYYLPWEKDRDYDLIIAARYTLGYGECVGLARFSEIDEIDYAMMFFELVIHGWAGARRHAFSNLANVAETPSPIFTHDGVKQLMTDLAARYLRENMAADLILPNPNARRKWRVYESDEDRYENYGGLIPTKHYVIGTREEAEAEIKARAALPWNERDDFPSKPILVDGILVDRTCP